MTCKSAYTKAIRVNGVPTGAIVKDQTYRAPKVKYRFVLERLVQQKVKL